MATGLLYAPQFLTHDTGPHHPERPDRLRAIGSHLARIGLLPSLERVEVTPVDDELLERVHSRMYIERFREACDSGERSIDTSDCAISRESFEAALLAAGGVCAAVDRVMSGDLGNAFCAVRPPGHHAERSTAMGFCFFNNIAVAAEHLRAGHGLRRIAIVDWDVHHGNGTQHHFETDPHVFFCSIHQHPETLFPGTGFADEKGEGEGVGSTLNLPMLPGSGDEEYRLAFEQHVLPALRIFRPEFVLVSAGFDPHRDDPLAQIRLTTEMFSWMTRELLLVAEECCCGRFVSILEGGYSLPALAESVEAHLRTLQDGL